MGIVQRLGPEPLATPPADAPRPTWSRLRGVWPGCVESGHLQLATPRLSGDLLALELDHDVYMVTLCTYLSVKRSVRSSNGGGDASRRTVGA